MSKEAEQFDPETGMTPAEARLVDEYEHILQEADAIIHGERAAQYGHPLEDFEITAEYWTTRLKSRGLLAAGKQLDAEDVAVMMGLMKMSREARSPDPSYTDNVKDDAGYIGTLGRVRAERIRRRALERKLARLREQPLESSIKFSVWRAGQESFLAALIRHHTEQSRETEVADKVNDLARRLGESRERRR